MLKESDFVTKILSNNKDYSWDLTMIKIIVSKIINSQIFKNYMDQTYIKKKTHNFL